MSIFESNSVQKLIRNWAESQANNGRGMYRRMAEHLRISPVLISQIMNGSRNLDEDHAYSLSHFMGLTSLESEYFLLLVQRERAGTAAYAKHLEEKLKKLKQESSQIRNRVAQDAVLSEEAKAIFYSHWKYSFIRLATSLPGEHSVDSLSQKLSIPRLEVAEAVEFLLAHNLCMQTKEGLKMGTQRTHLAKESPYYFSRQLQLRHLGQSALTRNAEQDLFFSAPLSISKKDAEWVRASLLELVSKLSARIEKSEATQIYCLNMDWFEFEPGQKIL